MRLNPLYDSHNCVCYSSSKLEKRESSYHAALSAAFAPGSPRCPLYIYGTLFRNKECDTGDLGCVFPIAEREGFAHISLVMVLMNC